MLTSIPIQSFEEYIWFIEPAWFFDTDLEVCNYIQWQSRTHKEDLPLWEEQVKKQEKDFVVDVMIKNSEWVKKKRIEFLKSSLQDIKEESIYWSEILFRMPDWIGEFIHERYIKILFKKKKNIEFEISGWINPNRNNNNKITKIDIEKAKEVPLKDILNLEPKKFGIDKTFYSSPWRNDSDPSLCVYNKTNTFTDFGDNTSGDSISLVMKLYSMEFLEAVKYLIRK